MKRVTSEEGGNKGAIKQPREYMEFNIFDIYDIVENPKQDLILDGTFSTTLQLSYRQVLWILIKKIDQNGEISDADLRIIEERSKRIEENENEIEKRIEYARRILGLISEIKKNSA